MVLLNILVDDLGVGVECILSKYADDTKLNGGLDLLEGRKSFQRDLDRLSHWAEGDCMSFYKVQCCVQHLCPSNPMQGYRLVEKWLGSFLVEKEPGGAG